MIEGELAYFCVRRCKMLVRANFLKGREQFLLFLTIYDFKIHIQLQ